MSVSTVPENFSAIPEPLGEEGAPVVVVAMSGGVDSAAAALLLVEAGYRVIGISMQVLSSHGGEAGRRKATCCGASDFNDARSVADRGGFPFYVLDFEAVFRESVISRFVESYREGVTPNPCIECNRRVKFRALRDRAAAFGAQAIATGHYARIRRNSTGELGLYTARDTEKDQSYFLYSLTQDELATTIFPIGEMLKGEVRSMLEQRGFSIASKPESQDICFVTESAGAFVEQEISKETLDASSREERFLTRPGFIIDADGRKLGEHPGVHHFTVGQRRGLRAGGARERLYVLCILPETNTVVVGPKSALEREGFCVSHLSWTGKSPRTTPFEALVKLRYRHTGIRCRVFPIGGGRAKVSFLDKWSTVSPGQAAVFYSLMEEPDGAREVCGGGTIIRDEDLEHGS